MKIVFLCVGNSCRSQMAEGFARELAAADVEIVSAGLEAHGLNPLAVRAMKDIGIDISRHTSEIFRAEMVEESDCVVTVCDRAREICPHLPVAIHQIHWSFDDPAEATGSTDDINTVFRRVRDEIGKAVKTLFTDASYRLPLSQSENL